MIGQMSVAVGDSLKCKYPCGGWRNILKNRMGVVVKVGSSYVTIEHDPARVGDRRFTTMMFSKMVSLTTAGV